MLSISALCSVYSSTLTSEFSLSIDSLLSNTSLPDQIVIVVDGPVHPDVNLLLDSYSRHPLFTIVTSKSNLGLGPALNLGISYCTSEFVLRFDTDDVNLSNRVSHARAFLSSNPHVDLLSTAVVEFFPGSSTQYYFRKRYINYSSFSNPQLMFLVNPINHPASVVRTSLFQSISLYPDCPSFEDYMLWLIFKKNRVVFASCSTPTVLMRRESLSSRRTGLLFFIRELKFYLRCISSSLLPPWSVPVLLFRLSLRLFTLPYNYFNKLVYQNSFYTLNIGDERDFLHLNHIFLASDS